MINDLFSLILKASASASIVILLLLIVTPFLNKRYFMKWKYRIWLLLSLYLCIPADYSKVYEYFSSRHDTKPVRIPVPTVANVTNSVLATLDTAKIPINPTMVSETMVNEAVVHETVSNLTMPSPLTILSWIWLLGVIVLFLIHGISYFSYKRKVIKNGLPVANTEYLSEFQKLQNSLQIHKDIKLLVWSGSSSPMMIGFFQPYLVLPNENYSIEEIHFILKHELLHCKNHDIYGKLLFVIAKTIHWFNPIVSLMCKEAVIDMELSCDEAVVSVGAAGGYDIRKNYAETLFNTLATQNNASSTQAKSKTYLSTQFHGGAKIMKKRFENILSKTKKRNGMVLVLATVLFIAGCQATTETKPAMYMEHTQLSEEEGKVAKLLGPDSMWLMLDFVLDDTLQSFQLNYYELIDGGWHSFSSENRNFTGTEGTLALKFHAINEYLDYEIESESDYAGGAHGSPSGNDTEEPSYTQISSATLKDNETVELVYEKEIPLLVQIVNPGDGPVSLERTWFFTPEKFTDLQYQHIYALTITFSRRTAEEISEDITEEQLAVNGIDTSYLPKAAKEQRPLITSAIITLNEFAIAYFTGDAETLKPYLSDSYSYAIDTYPYGETFTDVSELTFDAVDCHLAGETTDKIPKWAYLGISETNIDTDYDNLLISGVDVPIPNYEIGDGYTLVFSIPLKAVPFKDIDLDYREYLTVEMVKQGEGWKIQAYGLEL